MSIKYKFRNPDGYYFVTFAVVGWIDIFTRAIYKDILIEYLPMVSKKKAYKSMDM